MNPKSLGYFYFQFVQNSWKLSSITYIWVLPAYKENKESAQALQNSTGDLIL